MTEVIDTSDNLADDEEDESEEVRHIRTNKEVQG